MPWILIAGSLSLGIVTALAWFYPTISARLAARRRASRYRQVADARGLPFDAAGAAHATTGFGATVASVFGPFATVRNVVEEAIDGETVYLLEVWHGAKAGRFAYRRGAPAVVVHLAAPLLRFALRRAPGGVAKNRTTEFKAAGQRLVVQALDGEFELWATKQERARARRLAPPPLLAALRDEPGWSLRGVDRWLLLYRHPGPPLKSVAALERFRAYALELRGLLG